MPKRLIKNAIFLTLATYITMLANAALTITLARYLGANGLGIYTTVFTFVFFGTLVSSFGLPQVIVRNVAKNNLLAGTYFVNGLFIMVIFAFICFVFITGVAFLMNYPLRVKLLILLGCCSIITGVASDTSSSIFRAFEKMAIPSLIYSGMTILNSITGVVMLWKGLGLFPVVSVIVVTNGLSAGFLLLFYRKYFKGYFKHIDFKFSLGILKQSFPIALIRTFNVLTDRVDILMLSGMQGLASVGFYSASSKFINFVSVPLQSLGQASLPRMSAQLATSVDKLERTYDKLLKVFILMSLPVTVIVFFFSANIIHLIFGIEYIQGGSAVALKILILAFLFDMASGPVGYTILSSEESLNRLVPFMLAITILNIGLNIVLIPKYGFLGASFSALTCSIVGLIVKLILVSRLFHRKSRLLSISQKPVLAAVLMMGPLFFLKDSNWVLAGVAGFIAYIVALYILGEFKDWGIYVAKVFR